MTEHQQDANWNVAEWHGKMLVDRDGERIGKLQESTSTLRMTSRSSPPSRRASSAAI